MVDSKYCYLKDIIGGYSSLGNTSCKPVHLHHTPIKVQEEKMSNCDLNHISENAFSIKRVKTKAIKDNDIIVEQQEYDKLLADISNEVLINNMYSSTISTDE